MCSINGAGELRTLTPPSRHRPLSREISRDSRFIFDHFCAELERDVGVAQPRAMPFIELTRMCSLYSWCTVVRPLEGTAQSYVHFLAHSRTSTPRLENAYGKTTSFIKVPPFQLFGLAIKDVLKRVTNRSTNLTTLHMKYALDKSRVGGGLDVRSQTRRKSPAVTCSSSVFHLSPKDRLLLQGSPPQEPRGASDTLTHRHERVY